MFKPLLKTLQVAILSGALLNLSTISSAQVTSDQTAPFNVQAARANLAAYEAAQKNQQSSGPSLTTKGVDESNMAATLAMAAISLVTQRLWTCKMTTDMMIAAAGGAAFIAGEILSTIKLKKTMNDIQTELKRNDKGEIDQKQIEVLQKLRQSYVEAKGSANTKVMLQGAAAAAFAAAGIMAYVNANAELASQAAVNSAYAAAITACSSNPLTASATPVLTGVCTAHDAQDVADVTVLAPSMAKETEHELVEKPLLAQSVAATLTCPAAAPFQATLAAANLLNLQTKAFCPLSPGIVNNKNLNKFLYTEVSNKKSKFNFFDIIFSSAHADLLSPMGIVLGAGTVYLLSKTFGTQIDMFLYSPINRAITWAGLGVITAAATMMTKNQIGVIDENITKIDNILAEMNGLSKGVAAANTPPPPTPKPIGTNANPYNPQGINNNGYSDIDLAANGSGPLPCINGATSNCPNFSALLNKQEDLKGMPDSFMAQMKTLGTFTDGINGASKVSGSTLSAGGSLSASNNAISAALAKQQKAVQKKLTASGSKINLAKNVNDAESRMRAALTKELKDRNTSAAAVLAGFNGFAGNNAATASADKSKDSDKNAKKDAVANAGVVDISGASGFKTDKGVEIEGLAKADNAVKIDANEAKSTMDNYDLKNDITQNRDSSIFDLISNRYQKSGYPRLFKKVKE